MSVLSFHSWLWTSHFISPSVSILFYLETENDLLILCLDQLRLNIATLASIQIYREGYMYSRTIIETVVQIIRIIKFEGLCSLHNI